MLCNYLTFILFLPSVFINDTENAIGFNGSACFSFTQLFLPRHFDPTGGETKKILYIADNSYTDVGNARRRNESCALN